MATYIISYDLRKQKDYQKLIDEIKKYTKWAKILESTWAVVTISSAEEIGKHLKNYMDQDDGLFIMKSGKEAAWSQIICPDKWLIDNL